MPMSKTSSLRGANLVLVAHSGMACRIAHGDSTGGKRPWNGVMDCSVDSIWNGPVETLCYQVEVPVGVETGLK